MTFSIIVFAGIILVTAALIWTSAASAASQGGEVSGYAWSDTIGWMDLNCFNTDSCSTNDFKITLDSSGNMSGYAWSDTIGWISANAADLTGCPSGECEARISGSAMQGWLRALSAGGEGWDGWLSLSGDSYGPTLSSGVFSGYAWGSDVVGWVDWSYARTAYTPCIARYYCSANNQRYEDANCADTLVQVCPYQCAAGACIAPPPPSFNSGSGGLTGHLQVSPSLVQRDTATRIYWNVSGVSSCTVTGDNGDTWSGTASDSAGEVSSPITRVTVYTLVCTGMDESSVHESAAVRVPPVFQEL